MSTNTSAELSFGIDIGGSGMKAAPVELSTGALAEDRLKIATPQPSNPAALAEVVRRLVQHFGWTDAVGVGFPTIVRRGIAVTNPPNLDQSWEGVDIDALFTEAGGCPVRVVNDADAAGLAEVRYGAGRDRQGVILVATFGTGIGSGLFLDGKLVPNTELGHIEIDGEVAERRAAAGARDREGLSWKDWAARADNYLKRVALLVSPDLIIVGGGVSRKSDKWLHLLDPGVEVVPAALTNDAGIVGAALHAAE